MLGLVLFPGPTVARSDQAILAPYRDAVGLAVYSFVTSTDPAKDLAQFIESAGVPEHLIPAIVSSHEMRSKLRDANDFLKTLIETQSLKLYLSALCGPDAAEAIKVAHKVVTSAEKTKASKAADAPQGGEAASSAAAEEADRRISGEI